MDSPRWNGKTASAVKPDDIVLSQSPADLFGEQGYDVYLVVVPTSTRVPKFLDGGEVDQWTLVESGCTSARASDIMEHVDEGDF